VQVRWHADVDRYVMTGLFVTTYPGRLADSAAPASSVIDPPPKSLRSGGSPLGVSPSHAGRRAQPIRPACGYGDLAAFGSVERAADH
jgi:hypothetical protein